MKWVRATTLYDGKGLMNNVYVGFDKEFMEISQRKPEDEVIAEGTVTPAFIDAHSHIGMVRAGEPSAEDESNEHMDSVYPLVNALHSVYMDDSAFRESVENNFLYSTVLPGSGNPIGGKAVLIRNWSTNIGDAYIMDIGIKAALGYNPRSTTDWSGRRPTTRMGAVALLRERFIKAKKLMNLLKTGKKSEDEVEPLDEVFIDLLQRKLPMMVHCHKEDDANVLMSLVDEFGFRAILNHGLDIMNSEAFSRLKSKGINLVYGPLDAHPYKVELKHESWKNAKAVLESGIKFCLMSDHPVILQRNTFLTTRHFLKYGLDRAEAIGKLTREPAEILGIPSLGRVAPGYIASFSVWSADPFQLGSYPTMTVAEGRIIHET
ncbi:MAG TPA: amidohydrolase family protein [Thermoplasmataceae archaeon]|nr:amidohydrolase family protein [Thermoplasmataceae archaeon]